MTTINPMKPRRRGDAPTKVCHSCFACVPSAVKMCQHCGHQFPRATKTERQEAAAALDRWKDAQKRREVDRVAAAALEAAMAEGAA